MTKLAFAFLAEEKLAGKHFIQALIFFVSFLVSRQEMKAPAASRKFVQKSLEVKLKT